MGNRLRVLFAGLYVLEFVVIMVLLVHGKTMAVLRPAGLIARQERGLLVFATVLMLLVVVPVLTLTAWIGWKYRAQNTKAAYTPNWDSNKRLETIWWGIPILLITILAVVTWQSTHALDPFRPLAKQSKPPIKIQVIALQWKWLFIYPEQRVATVNYVQLPIDTPVTFEITSDAPMNSFWIPQLAGQVYAMSGMSTELHVLADKPGSYDGVSANLSGKGFAGMKFTTKVTSDTEFADWVSGVRQTGSNLDTLTYGQLASPTENAPVAYYRSGDATLYDTVVHKYMASSDNMSLMTSSGESHQAGHQ